MLVMTSFAFMFVEVPAPPWMTPTMNSSWNSPSITFCAAASMRSAFSGSRTPISRFARALACFTMASASISSG